MIDRVIALLQQTQLDLNAEDIADALWLARYLEAEEAIDEEEELVVESAPIAEAPDREHLPNRSPHRCLLPLNHRGFLFKHRLRLPCELRLIWLDRCVH